MDRVRGFSLIELVVFIVVVGIAATGIMLAFVEALSGAGAAPALTRGSQIGQQRIELIIANKRLDGFPGSDPCAGNGLVACNVPAGFTVTSEIIEWGGVDPCDDTMTHCQITVTVDAPGGAVFTLNSLITRLKP